MRFFYVSIVMLASGRRHLGHVVDVASEMVVRPQTDDQELDNSTSQHARGMAKRRSALAKGRRGLHAELKTAAVLSSATAAVRPGPRESMHGERPAESGSQAWPSLRSATAAVRHAIETAASLGAEGGVFHRLGRGAGLDPAVPIGILFTLTFVLYSLKIMCIDYPRANAKTEERNNQKQLMHVLFMGNVRQLVSELESARERSGRLAQLHFQERHRGMVRAAVALLNSWWTKSYDKDSNPFVDVVRDHFYLRCVGFETCGPDPVTAPLVLCAGETFDACPTIEAVAGLFQQCKHKKMPDLAGDDIQEAQAIKDELTASQATGVQSGSCWLACACGLGGSRQSQSRPWPYDITCFCLKLTLLSAWHAMLLWFFLFGIGFGTVMHLQNKHVLGGAVNLATFLLAVVLAMAVVPLDEDRMLTVELEDLKEKSSSVEVVHKKIRSWAKRYDRATKLWQEHTMNKLDVLSALESFFWGTEPPVKGSKEEKQRLAFFVELNAKIRSTFERLGEPRLYIDKKAVDETLVTTASQHIKNKIVRIGELADKHNYTATLRALDTFFGVVRVRVQSATHLSRVDCDSHVVIRELDHVVRVGEKRFQDCQKTAVVEQSQDPSWNEEFDLWMPEKDHFSLEVFGAEECIGFVTVSFRDVPNQWIDKTEHLVTLTGKKLKSKLAFQFCFASSINHLPCLDQGPNADMGITVTSFLNKKKITNETL